TGYKDETDIDGEPSSLRTTPVHRAARRDHDHIVRELFKVYDGFDVNYVDESGYTHFHAACMSSCIVAVEKFLELGQDPNLLVPETRDSPLHLALNHDYKLKIVALLLRKGADPNTANSEGKTPLHILRDGHCGNDLEHIFFKIIDEKHGTLRVDARDKLGNTPLHLALRNDNTSTAESLLRRGADPNLADADGTTALHLICQRDRDGRLLQLFFKICDERQQLVKIDARDKLGRTPLQWAVANLRPDAVDALLDRGADLAEFVFPDASYFGEERGPKHHMWGDFELNLASGAMIVVERLEKRGYELRRNDALTIMEMFSKCSLFHKFEGLEERWYDEQRFKSEAKETTIVPSLSLYDLIQLQPDEAAKLLAYEDYFRFASSGLIVIISSRKYRKVCANNLCEKLLREFYRRWALEFFLEKTRYLMNEDLHRISMCSGDPIKRSRETTSSADLGVIMYTYRSTHTEHIISLFTGLIYISKNLRLHSRSRIIARVSLILIYKAILKQTSSKLGQFEFGDLPAVLGSLSDLELNSMLITACEQQHELVVGFFQMCRIKIRGLPKICRTAIHVAAKFHMVETFYRLCDIYGTRVNHRELWGNFTHLQAACKIGHAGLVKSLLATGPEKYQEDLNLVLPTVTGPRCRPDPRVLDLLLSHGARADLADGSGATLLARLCRQYATNLNVALDDKVDDHLEIIRTLVRHKADVNAIDRDGLSPAQQLYRYGIMAPELQLGALRILLEAGARARHRDNRADSVLHYALRRHHLRRLHGPVFDPPRHSWNVQQVLRLLVREHGAEVDALSEEGQTPLSLAVSFCDLDAVETLLELGADPRTVSFEGNFLEPINEFLRNLELTQNLLAIIELLKAKGFVMQEKHEARVLKFLLGFDTTRSYFDAAYVIALASNATTIKNHCTIAKEDSSSVLSAISNHLRIVQLGNMYISERVKNCLLDMSLGVNNEDNSNVVEEEETTKTTSSKLKSKNRLCGQIHATPTILKELDRARRTMIMGSVSLLDFCTCPPDKAYELLEDSRWEKWLANAGAFSSYFRCIGPTIKGYITRALARKYLDGLKPEVAAMALAEDREKPRGSGSFSNGNSRAPRAQWSRRSATCLEYPKFSILFKWIQPRHHNGLKIFRQVFRHLFYIFFSKAVLKPSRRPALLQTIRSPRARTKTIATHSIHSISHRYCALCSARGASRASREEIVAAAVRWHCVGNDTQQRQHRDNNKRMCACVCACIDTADRIVQTLGFHCAICFEGTTRATIHTEKEKWNLAPYITPTSLVHVLRRTALRLTFASVVATYGERSSAARCQLLLYIRHFFLTYLYTWREKTARVATPKVLGRSARIIAPRGVYAQCTSLNKSKNCIHDAASFFTVSARNDVSARGCNVHYCIELCGSLSRPRERAHSDESEERDIWTRINFSVNIFNTVYIVYRQGIGTAAAAAQQQPCRSLRLTSRAALSCALPAYILIRRTSITHHRRRGEKRESGSSQPAAVWWRPLCSSSSSSNPRCRTRKQHEDNPKRCVSLLYDKKREGQISILQITRFNFSQRAHVLYSCARSRISNRCRVYIVYVCVSGVTDREQQIVSCAFCIHIIYIYDISTERKGGCPRRETALAHTAPHGYSVTDTARAAASSHADPSRLRALRKTSHDHRDDDRRALCTRPPRDYYKTTIREEMQEYERVLQQQQHTRGEFAIARRVPRYNAGVRYTFYKPINVTIYNATRRLSLRSPCTICDDVIPFPAWDHAAPKWIQVRRNPWKWSQTTKNMFVIFVRRNRNPSCGAKRTPIGTEGLIENIKHRSKEDRGGFARARLLGTARGETNQWCTARRSRR
ncbi:unnamed protein product, partial [Trichogramma brassicae]